MDSCLSLTLQNQSERHVTKHIPHRAKPCKPGRVRTLRLSGSALRQPLFFFSTPVSKPFYTPEKKRKPKTPVTSRQTNLTPHPKAPSIEDTKLQQAASTNTTHNWRTFTLDECENLLGQDLRTKKRTKIGPAFPAAASSGQPEISTKHRDQLPFGRLESPGQSTKCDTERPAEKKCPLCSQPLMVRLKPQCKQPWEGQIARQNSMLLLLPIESPRCCLCSRAKTKDVDTAYVSCRLILLVCLVPPRLLSVAEVRLGPAQEGRRRERETS